MNPIQVVIDTNVMVTASRSKSGASYRLLQMLEDPRFEINLSTALLLEYEEKLKAEEKARQPPEADLAGALNLVDRFLNYLVSVANPRSVYPIMPKHLIHCGDQFVFDLAVASGAQFIVTYNLRHFAGAVIYGIYAIRPAAFLRLLEKLS